MTDRLPPNAPEAERAVIGCCLTTPVESLPEAQSVLSDESFYDHRNKIIWKEICGMPLDAVNVITVRQSVRDKHPKEKIDDAYLAQCQDEAFSSANLPVWIQALMDKQTLRRVISVCTKAISSAYEGKDNILDALESEILAIRPNQSATRDIKELVQQALVKIESKFQNPHSLSGLSTGLSDLDALSDGLHKGEMVVVAGFPATGKTALAVNIAVHNSIRGIPCAIFSAEMRPVQLVVRSICSQAHVNFHRICADDFGKMTHAAGTIANAPLHIDQANRLSIGQVMALARRMKQKFDIQLAVVDYIQLLTGHGSNREQEISSISKGIKAMALELDIPVLGLSQLTDDGQLRESRAIGQDADTVWKLENDGEWQAEAQPIKLRVDKCRDGATGKVDLWFLKIYTTFENASKVSDEDMP